jgi:hypothetical protein
MSQRKTAIGDGSRNSNLDEQSTLGLGSEIQAGTASYSELGSQRHEKDKMKSKEDQGWRRVVRNFTPSYV